jgi:hypothetical protein
MIQSFDLPAQFLIRRQYGSFEIIAVDPRTADNLHAFMGFAVVQHYAVAPIVATA